MYLEESRAILHISVTVDDLAMHSQNLPTFLSICSGGPYCLLSSSVDSSGTQGFQDPKRPNAPNAAGSDTEQSFLS